MKLRKGDTIKVVAGKDAGRTGKIERTYAKKDAILIPGVNIYKRHVKKSDQVPQGGVVEIPRPLAVSKVVLICPKCKKNTRVGYKIVKKKKIRVCKHCDQQI